MNTRNGIPHGGSEKTEIDDDNPDRKNRSVEAIVMSLDVLNHESS